MVRFFAAVALMALPGAALAQRAAVAGEQQSAGTQRIRSVTLTGNQACPESTGDEIVVCSRIRPGEQYRIPPSLRHEGEENLASNQSWVNRAETIDNVGRQAAGLPNTCSPIGTGGQTGCTLQMIQQYAAERAAGRRAASAVP